MSPGQDSSYLALSTDINVGRVSLYNLLAQNPTECSKKMMDLDAHNTPVIFMTFNEKGNLLATVSCNVFLLLLIY